MTRFPFPETFTGWYRVAGSDEVAARSVRPLSALGRELVVARGEDDRARVFDAHCPHLGAHLGHGGVVAGNGIRCPFHGWCFDGAGACASIPYAQKIPPRAQLRAWETREIAGRILVWADAAGRPPSFEPPAVPEHGSPEWDGPVRRRWMIRTHPLEIGENIVDPAHFMAVHGIRDLPVTEAGVDGRTFHATTRLVQRTPRGDVPTQIRSETESVGMWRVRFSGIVETMLYIDATPLGDDRVAADFTFYVTRSGGAGVDGGVGAAMIREICKQTEEDIPIWENKIYRTEPLLCGGEGGIPALRRWARAFYSSSTP